jgi:hypothetical protein
MLFFFVVAIFMYVMGYLGHNNARENLGAPGFFMKRIRVPKFIFLICAAPKLKKYPSGIMLTAGLISQLLGIGSAIYALVFFAFPEAQNYSGLYEVVIEMVSLAGIIAVSYFIPYWLSKKYPYDE